MPSHFRRQSTPPTRACLILQERPVSLVARRRNHRGFHLPVRTGLLASTVAVISRRAWLLDPTDARPSGKRQELTRQDYALKGEAQGRKAAMQDIPLRDLYTRD